MGAGAELERGLVNFNAQLHTEKTVHRSAAAFHVNSRSLFGRAVAQVCRGPVRCSDADAEGGPGEFKDADHWLIPPRGSGHNLYAQRFWTKPGCRSALTAIRRASARGRGRCQ